MSPHSPTPPIHPSTHHDRALYQYMCSISKPIRTPACLKTQSPFRCIGRGKIINKHGAFLFPGHKEVCMASYCPSKVCLVHFDAAPVLDVPQFTFFFEQVKIIMDRAKTPCIYRKKEKKTQKKWRQKYSEKPLFKPRDMHCNPILQLDTACHLIHYVTKRGYFFGRSASPLKSTGLLYIEFRTSKTPGMDIKEVRKQHARAVAK